MSHGRGENLRLLAFAERPAEDGDRPVELHVYIVNDSHSPLKVLKELDSINVPQSPPREGEAVADADLTHIDFGTSGSATFEEIAEGECVRITLLLRAEQFATLERTRYLKTAVKLQDGGDGESEVTTMLLPASVYLVQS